MDTSKSSLGEKSTALIIDEFFTTLFKCWYAQEDIMDESLSTEVRLEAAIKAQRMNARRAALMRLLDERLGESHRTVLEKTYAKEEEYTYFLDEKRKKNDDCSDSKP